MKEHLLKGDMHHTTRKAFTGSSILTIALLACQVAGGMISTPTLTSTPTRTPRPTSTAKPTSTPAPVRAEASQKIISGGFNYAPLKGFDGYSNNYEAYMVSPDETITVLLTSNAPFPGEHINTTLKQIMEYIADEFQNTTNSERQEIRHDGVSGVTADFSGTDAGIPFQGRTTILRPSQGKQLIIHIVIHGKGKWEQQGEAVYSTVLENISFFKITPLADCPVSTNRAYGYSKEYPIKIGGDISEGPDREDVYLSALLGPHAEVVSYYREGSEDGGEVILDKYIIRFGNEIKTLYIDMYNYQDPKAPFGMTCSGPFPEPASPPRSMLYPG